MKKVTLSLVALLLCLCIQAQHRSEQEAIQIAQEFFAKKQMKKEFGSCHAFVDGVDNIMVNRKYDVYSVDGNLLKKFHNS